MDKTALALEKYLSGAIDLLEFIRLGGQPSCDNCARYCLRERVVLRNERCRDEDMEDIDTRDIELCSDWSDRHI